MRSSSCSLIVAPLNFDVFEVEFFIGMVENHIIRQCFNLVANAIEATAWAVRRCTNGRDFERVLAKLPAEARAFWHVDVADPAELEQRII